MCNLSTADQQIAEDIIEAKVKNEEMFTAHELGIAAKQAGGSVSPRELRLMAHELFGGQGQGADGGWFASQGYTRTLIDVGDSIRPWLYHPIGADITPYTDKFKSRQSQSAPVVSKPAPSNPLGIAQPDSLDDDDDEDSSIATKPQRQVGVAATVAQPGGGFMHQTLRQPTGPIAPIAPKAAPKVTTLKPRQNADKDGRVFIGRDCLSKLGLKSGDKVVLEGDNGNRIEVYKSNNDKGDYTVNADFRIRLGKPKREKLKLDGNSFKIELDTNGSEPRLVVTKVN